MKEHNRKWETVLTATMLAVAIAITVTMFYRDVYAQALVGEAEVELEDKLAVLRKAIADYKAEHFDHAGVVTSDGYGLKTDDEEAALVFKDQMMLFTSEHGAVSYVLTGSCNLGPYIAEEDWPVNPANGKGTVVADVSVTDDRAARVASGKNEGWKIYPRAGVIFADDGDNLSK